MRRQRPGTGRRPRAGGRARSGRRSIRQCSNAGRDCTRSIARRATVRRRAVARRGPNLLRSPVILDDQDGELLLPIVRAGRPERGMPPRPDLTEARSRTSPPSSERCEPPGGIPARNRPATIVVGDAAAGQAYFAATCAKCHSATGDLKGLATKYPRPAPAAAGSGWPVPPPADAARLRARAPKPSPSQSRCRRGRSGRRDAGASRRLHRVD